MPGALLRLLRPQENAGVAAIEFAIYGMVFLMIVAATVDIGLLIFTGSQLDAAVSAGAEYAVNYGALVASNPSGLNTSISGIVNNAVGTGWATSTINVNNGNDSTHCYCPTGTPGNWIWGSTVTCGSACAGGGIGGQFVTITASRAVRVTSKGLCQQERGADALVPVFMIEDGEQEPGPSRSGRRRRPSVGFVAGLRGSGARWR